MSLKLKEAADLAEELSFSIRDLIELIDKDSRDQLNAGLHMMSVYERLMIALESEMHPAYRKNLEEFRSEKLKLGN
jgi:hypothetical protein